MEVGGCGGVGVFVGINVGTGVGVVVGVIVGVAVGHVGGVRDDVRIEPKVPGSGVDPRPRTFKCSCALKERTVAPQTETNDPRV